MCKPCNRSDIPCEFPAGRKRKRTKYHEMLQSQDVGTSESTTAAAVDSLLPVLDSVQDNLPDIQFTADGNIDWLALLAVPPTTDPS